MVLNIEESETDEPIISEQSKQYTVEQFCNVESLKESNFSVLSFNARSICDKLGDLEILLHDIESDTGFTFDIIAIQETWTDSNSESLIHLPNYKFVCKHKKKSKRGGGLGIFIKDCHSFKPRNDLFQVDENNIFDGLFIEIENNYGKNIVIGNLYRSPSYASQEEFTELGLIWKN